MRAPSFGRPDATYSADWMISNTKSNGPPGLVEQGAEAPQAQIRSASGSTSQWSTRRNANSSIRYQMEYLNTFIA